MKLQFVLINSPFKYLVIRFYPSWKFLPELFKSKKLFKHSSSYFENSDFVTQLTFFLVLEPLLIDNLDGDIEAFHSVFASVHDTELTRTENFVGKDLVKLGSKRFVYACLQTFRYEYKEPKLKLLKSVNIPMKKDSSLMKLKQVKKKSSLTITQVRTKAG